MRKGKGGKLYHFFMLISDSALKKYGCTLFDMRREKVCLVRVSDWMEMILSKGIILVLLVAEYCR
jgi:hypothetical protein